MTVNRSKIVAYGLISGGLDSALALAHMKRLGFDVRAYHLANGVHASIVPGAPKSSAMLTAKQLNIPVTIIDSAQQLLEVVKHPEHGYGSNLNPCIDCRILMFRLASARLKADGGHFLFTGEVVGQRPMSQRRQAMEMIDRVAEVEKMIVRPLCGKLLPPTLAEEQGWLSRDDLLDLQGRTRKPQMALARQYGLTETESPAGGCLLTDPGFSVRLRDLMRYTEPTLENVNLLKVGRHFRLNPQTKIVLGRNAQDCADLLSLMKADSLRLEARDTTGPVATILGQADEAAVNAAAALVARYCRHSDDSLEQVIMVRRGPTGDDVVAQLSVLPVSESEANHMLIAAEGGCGQDALPAAERQV